MLYFTVEHGGDDVINPPNKRGSYKSNRSSDKGFAFFIKMAPAAVCNFEQWHILRLENINNKNCHSN